MTMDKKTLNEWDTPISKTSSRNRTTLASESEAIVLPTPDSIFIKISRTPRSAVSPDKGVLAMPTVRLLWNRRHPNRYVTSWKSSMKSFHLCPTIFASVAEINAAWICRIRVGS